MKMHLECRITKNVMSVMLTGVFVVFFLLNSPSVYAGFGLIELGYDDGEADAGVSDLANKTYGWGVLFTHPEPGKPYQIRGIKIYVYMIKGKRLEKGALRVFIYVHKPAIGAYIQRAQMIIDDLSIGWNLINLTKHTIVVNRNFIVGVNWMKNYIIYVGDDLDTYCHSGGFNTTKITGFEHFEERNFMIRTLVQKLPKRTFSIKCLP